MKNIMNPKLSSKAIQRGLVGALLLSAAAVFADTQVTFQVDMSAQLGSTFNPPSTGGTDQVWAQGSFNNWGHANMTQVGNSSVWTVTVDDTLDANATVMSYKFGDTQQNYEAPLADGNNWNRVATLPSTSGAESDAALYLFRRRRPRHRLFDYFPG